MNVTNIRTQPKKNMATLNFEQWNAWTTEVQNEHSKLNNTDCCVCYSYCVLNNSICGECKNYVCKECSEKLEYNECPICRTTGIVHHRPVEPQRENARNNVINDDNNQPITITGNIVEVISYLYSDYINFENNYRRNNANRNNANRNNTERNNTERNNTERNNANRNNTERNNASRNDTGRNNQNTNNTERNNIYDNNYEHQHILHNNHIFNPINNIPIYNTHPFISIHPTPIIPLPRQM